MIFIVFCRKSDYSSTMPKHQNTASFKHHIHSPWATDPINLHSEKTP